MHARPVSASLVLLLGARWTLLLPLICLLGFCGVGASSELLGLAAIVIEALWPALAGGAATRGAASCILRARDAMPARLAPGAAVVIALYS